MMWGVYIALCFGLACPSPLPVGGKVLLPTQAAPNQDGFWFLPGPTWQRPDPLYLFAPSRSAPPAIRKGR
jgi:hypothetical protein